MNGNNINNQHLVNIIREVATKYGLTQNQVNEIYQRYQNNPNQPNNIKNEIDDLGNFYYHQNKLIIMQNQTQPLQPGKNYYITTFDKNSNIYLQPVSITVTNPETSEVLVENTLKG